MKTRLLLTRGMDWEKMRDWRILQMAAEPHLLTCRALAQMSACLTPTEAARVVLKRHPEAELYMWDELNYIPTRDVRPHKAIRVVGVAPNGLLERNPQ